MIEERVRVRHIQDGRIYIERTAEGGCGSCKQRCLGSEFAKRNRQMDLPSFPSDLLEEKPCAGDELVLRIHDRILLANCVKVYLLPVLFLLAFAGCGAFLSKYLVYPNEYLPVALGVAGLLISQIGFLKPNSLSDSEVLIEKLPLQ